VGEATADDKGSLGAAKAQQNGAGFLPAENSLNHSE